ncbi:MAG TPA: putative toxin-antitoxin system toxin component, PIN family [Myxococcota bacterium]|nr:putative toxin-antitoxin system toxin component, PIN family [Myxococcota bacterium]
MRVVLDANVYIGAEVSPRGVCSKALKVFTKVDSAFELIVTEMILAEVHDVLIRPRIMKLTGKNKGQISQAVEDIAQIAVMVPDIPISPKECRDPKDVIYLAAARTAKASLIVSWDQDLLDLLEYEGIKIVKPDIFIEIVSQIND